MTNPEHLRKSYHHGILGEKDLTPDPLDLFRQWWHEAIEAEIDEANAMTLATVNREGQPAARIVLLKGLSHEGFEFFTNYESRKSQDLEDNPQVALLFFWKELERQVRLEGKAEKVSQERSKKYFQSRPRGNQFGGWVSPQSRVIPDRTILEENLRHVQIEFADVDPLPLPPHWGGYLVRPQRYEFWQGRPDRLHDRFRYTLHGQGAWAIDRLAP